jgi:glycosyltransferase involved in cell wall biosynthesis
MRVLMLDPSFSGGGYVHNLANALAEEGCTVELATSPHFERSSRGWRDIRYRPSIRFYRRTQMRSYARGPLRPMWQALRFVGHNWSLWRVLRAATSFDVVHVHLPPVPLVDARWLRWISRRTVLALTVHNLYPHDSSRSARTRRALGTLYASSHILFVHTDATRDGLLREFGVAPERIVKVPFGNYAHMLPAEPTPDSRGERDGVPIVLLFGELRLNKGLEVLIDAAALLRERGARFRVLLAGKPGVSVEAYRAQVRGLGLEDIVEFRVGYIPEESVADVFESAAVVALPYTAIDHSAVAVTAATLGRALVASDLAGLSELVRSADNGLLVPPSDPAALANALEMILSQRPLREKFERNSREYARRALDWKPIAQRTIEAYQAGRTCPVTNSSVRRGVH